MIKAESFVPNNTGIYLPPRGAGKFAYEDRAEKDLLRVLNACDDRSSLSDELDVHGTKSWPFRYHLSQNRANLLRPLELPGYASVLEFGGGCGGVSRYLAEVSGHLTIVEGDLDRARCNAARLEGCSNARIYCCNFQEIEFPEAFDIVTLIGVLEYSSKYLTGANPFLTCLDIAKRNMKADGRLLLAIENRNGLKYFAGAREDHTGRPYVGLEDLYRPDTARTFGKKELIGLLTEAGFVSTRFYYPFPDYKMPCLLLTELAFDSDEFCASDLIFGAAKAKRSGAFHVGLVLGQLEQNGLLPHLANSFLVEATLQELPPLLPASTLGAWYNLTSSNGRAIRKREFKTATFFHKRHDSIEVEKKRICAAEPSALQDLQANSPYILGQLMNIRLARLIKAGQVRRFWELLAGWVEWLKCEAVKESSDNWQNSAIKPDYFDGIPRNLVLTDKDGMKLIDREWVIPWPYELRHLIVRGLLMIGVECRDSLHARGMEDFLDVACHKLGVDAPDRDYVERIENRFYDLIFTRMSDKPASLLARAWSRWKRW